MKHTFNLSGLASEKFKLIPNVIFFKCCDKALNPVDQRKVSCVIQVSTFGRILWKKRKKSKNLKVSHNDKNDLFIWTFPVSVSGKYPD